MDEKERIEREALTFFLRLYNRQKGQKWRFHQKRERPDFIIRNRLHRDELGVEISHIFHDKKEAMMFLGRDNSTFHGLITAQDHVNVLIGVLRKKAEKVKHYPYRGPMLLVIRDYSRLFDAETILDPRMGLKVPALDYREVWYLTRSRPVRKWDQLLRIK